MTQSLVGGEQRPIRDAQPLRNHLVVQVRMLSDVEGRQMKAKGAHSAHEAAHQEISGVASAIQGQALGRERHVRKQFVRALVGIGPPFVGRLEPLADLAEEHPVRHPIVPCRGQRLCTRQYGAVGIDARGERGADAHAFRALTQGLGELAALGKVGRHDHLPMAMQGFANGLAMQIRIAVHVAADP